MWRIYSGSKKRSLTPLVKKKAYESYFSWKFWDQDKLWAPHICCGTCASKINKWLQGSRPLIHFAVPMVWWEQKTVISVWPKWKTPLHSRRTIFSTRICTPQYGQSHMTVSPFQSLQLTGTLVMKARRASQTKGVELQPVQRDRIQISFH